MGINLNHNIRAAYMRGKIMVLLNFDIVLRPACVIIYYARRRNACFWRKND
jgi:hypothetical protein